MNRATAKYDGKFTVADVGLVQVVAVEHNTVSMMGTHMQRQEGGGWKRTRGPRQTKRWYLVLACCNDRGKTWLGKLATTGAVAQAVKARIGL